jgi:serine/threonine protein kinase/tetratricopeptide (TPR) repeat protein
MREGDVIADRYRLLRHAASGGMGTVYQAIDTLSGAHVAVKTLRTDLPREPVRGRSRLLREAEALAALRHPAVVRYLDHGLTAESEPFLVMAWVDGDETLQNRLEAGGLTAAEALQLAARLASGLAAVHACGVVHRDLKPSNVMLGGGRLSDAILVDFGVARVTRSTTDLTATGDHLGTPRYMAPEQIRNPRTVDARADVFALGCILFECLTGRVCFVGDDAVEVIARILFAPLSVPSAIRPDLPRALDGVVATMLVRDARSRPAASEAERLLHHGLEAIGPAARDLPAPRRLAMEPSQAPELSATAWGPSDDLTPPQSFELGSNAVATAARKVLPLEQGAFFGREEARSHLVSVLRAGTPTVVVWGGPGIGKTRFVAETLRRIGATRDSPWDALVFGDLREARTADDVVRLLARESGISLESSASPEIALGRALGKLGRVLLVLDSVEHLGDLLAAIVRAFAHTAPATQVLATSRRRWSAGGALSIELGPLSTATMGGAPSPAALLLLERAGLFHPMTEGSGASLEPALLDRAERVASALEGIPMAIELSAAHVQLLGLDGLHARVCAPRERGAATTTSPGVEPMRRALDRSWDLLNEDERRAFVQCSVFRGGFTVAAAEAVVRVEASAPPTLTLLQSLRDSSLLYSCGTEPAQAGRLSMFAPLHEFASERLQGDELQAALRRHAAYYAGVEGWEPHEAVADRMARIELEADNLLAAAEFSLSDDAEDPTPGIKALVALEPAIFSRGAVTEYLALLDRAIERADAVSPLGMVARQTRARFDATSGRSDRARTDLLACLDDARRRQDPRREGAVLLDLGVANHLQRNFVAARTCYETAIERLSDAEDPGTLGRCLGNVGAVHHDEGQLGEASRFYRQAIVLLEQAGETRRRANFIGNLAVLEQELAHFDESRRLFDYARSLLEPLRDARLLAITLGNYGALELELKNADRAAALYQRSLALLAGTGDVPSRALCLGRFAAALSLLGRTSEAELHLRQAERLAARTDVVVTEAVALIRGFVDVAAAREASAGGLRDAAEQHLSQARARLERVLVLRDGERLLRECSDDIRAMQRVLSAALSSTCALLPGAPVARQ